MELSRTLRPYISITDFTTPDQVRDMLRAFRRFLDEGQDRVLGVGVMTFGKMYRGEQTRWSATCPTLGAIADIFEVGAGDVLNCLHYADFAPPVEVWRNIAKALEYAGPYVDALQLDMCWPEPDQIARAVHASRKPVEVILQVGRNAFDVVDNNPKRLVEKLEDYEGVIHRVLLDKSMGEGKEMDPHFLLPFFRAVRERFPTMGLVGGGGLGPYTTHHVEPIHSEFRDMSYDAQGKLHLNRDLFRPVNWLDASQYLVEMLIRTR